MTPVKIKLLREGAVMPAYQTDGAAAVDLCALIDADVTLAPGERALIPTGLAIAMKREVVALIFARSGLASKHGITLSNAVGVIDSDYRGEIKIALVNRGSEPFTVHSGDRIAQMGFFPCLTAAFLPTDTLDETERGAGGFGHTGI